jgi:hypothetical protein
MDRRREGVNNWFNNTLISRLDDVQTGAIVVVMQRLHDDDLTGALLRSPERWVQLKPPAIAEEEQIVPIGPNTYHIRRVGDLLHPDRVPRSFLESLRSLDPDTFAARYQQTPIPAGGIIIQRKWVRWYDELPSRTPSSVILQSWDTASKLGESSDWSVCTTWLFQENKYYLMDVLRERLSVNEAARHCPCPCVQSEQNPCRSSRRRLRARGRSERRRAPGNFGQARG